MTDPSRPSDALAAGDPRAILLSPDAPATRRWYQGRGALLVAVIAVLLAVTIVTDLPTPTSHADSVAAATAYVREIRGDVAGCALAVTQSLEIRRAQLDGTLSAGDRATIPSLLTQDEEGCTGDSPLIDDLLNVAEPGTSVHTALVDMYDGVVTWSADGLKVVEGVQVLYDHPRGAGGAATLASVVSALDAQRTVAVSELDDAVRALHAPLGGLGLPEATTPR